MGFPYSPLLNPWDRPWVSPWENSWAIPWASQWESPWVTAQGMGHGKAQPMAYTMGNTTGYPMGHPMAWLMGLHCPYGVSPWGIPPYGIISSMGHPMGKSMSCPVASYEYRSWDTQRMYPWSVRRLIRVMCNTGGRAGVFCRDLKLSSSMNTAGPGYSTITDIWSAAVWVQPETKEGTAVVSAVPK